MDGPPPGTNNSVGGERRLEFGGFKPRVQEVAGALGQDANGLRESVRGQPQCLVSEPSDLPQVLPRLDRHVRWSPEQPRFDEFRQPDQK